MTYPRRNFKKGDILVCISPAVNIAKYYPAGTVCVAEGDSYVSNKYNSNREIVLIQNSLYWADLFVDKSKLTRLQYILYNIPEGDK